MSPQPYLYRALNAQERLIAPPPPLSPPKAGAAYQSQKLLEATPPPAWLVQLEAQLEEWDWSNLSSLRQKLTASDGGLTSTQRLYLELVAPFLAPSLENLTKELQNPVEAAEIIAGFAPFRPERVLSLLLPGLLENLQYIIDSTVALEVNLAHLKGHLAGNDGQDRFADFIAQLCTQQGFEGFCREYPVLIRLVFETISRWHATTLEFLKRLCQDWFQILSFFGLSSGGEGETPLELVQIRDNAGDNHRGGQRVIILKFSDGRHLVYKPRPLALEQHFQGLLEWLNRQAGVYLFHPLTMLDQGIYGWVEYVEARESETSADLTLYYERLGSYLALLYLLRGTDVHADNLLACVNEPILLDLETLFQPCLEQSLALSESEQDPAWQRLRFSVVGVNLLESLALRQSWGGLRITHTQNRGTSEMRIVRHKPQVSSYHHLPALKGQVSNPRLYLESLIAGFSRFYGLIQKNQAEFAQELLHRFGNDQLRVIMRPSWVYEMLLHEGYHPDLMRDGLALDQHFERLQQALPIRPWLVKFIPSEKADLWKGDIPCFEGWVSGRELAGSQGEQLGVGLKKPVLEEVVQHLQELSSSELERQLWFIRASIASWEIGEPVLSQESWFGVPTPRERSVRAGENISDRELLAEACQIGDRLNELACWNNTQQEANWLSYYQQNNCEWQLQPTGPDLYQGVSGITLFLASLGAVSGQDSYEKTARAALEVIQQQLKKYQQQQAKGTRVLKVGAYDGLSGVIYLYTYLANLWSEAALLTQATNLAGWLSEVFKPEEDYRLDVISGSSGAILANTNLYRSYPEEVVLDSACKYADHLVAQLKSKINWEPEPSEPPGGQPGWLIPGMAHGLSGIALALWRLSQISGKELYREVALKALECEARLLSGSKWTNLNSSWCRGTAGIGLTRLCLLEEGLAVRGTSFSEYEKAIQQATALSVPKESYREASLCHGLAGSLLLVQRASGLMGKREYPRSHQPLKAGLVQAIRSGKGNRQGALPVAAPGLMTGLAGQGLSLLHLLESKEKRLIPLPLTLE